MGGPDEPMKRRPESVWAQYARNMLPLATVLGGIGLLLIGLSFLVGQQMRDGTRGAALIDLAAAVIAALVGLGWRLRRGRPAP